MRKQLEEVRDLASETNKKERLFQEKLFAFMWNNKELISKTKSFSVEYDKTEDAYILTRKEWKQHPDYQEYDGLIIDNIANEGKGSVYSNCLYIHDGYLTLSSLSETIISEIEDYQKQQE